MKIRLRDVELGDLPVLFQHQSDATASRMAAFEPRDREAFLVHWSRLLRHDRVIKQTILVDDEVAGNVVSFPMDGRREVGYWVGREYWGRGVATEALSRFLEGFTERPLYAVVATHNAASVRVLEKCGFLIESRTGGSPAARGPVVEEYVLRLDADAASERAGS